MYRTSSSTWRTMARSSGIAVTSASGTQDETVHQVRTHRRKRGARGRLQSNDVDVVDEAVDHGGCWTNRLQLRVRRACRRVRPTTMRQSWHDVVAGGEEVHGGGMGDDVALAGAL